MRKISRTKIMVIALQQSWNLPFSYCSHSEHYTVTAILQGEEPYMIQYPAGCWLENLENDINRTLCESALYDIFQSYTITLLESLQDLLQGMVQRDALCVIHNLEKLLNLFEVRK